MSGIEMANWNWKVVRQFVSKRFGIGLSRSACLNYLHRLGFVLKGPKKRLVKADEQKREAFVAEYAHPVGRGVAYGSEDILRRRGPFPGRCRTERQMGAKGRAGPPFPRGQALVDSTSPSDGEKASYYSAVCLETGESLPSRKRGWSGWTWRGTATPEPRLPSWSGCGRGAPGRST